ncbi:BlaI/MecI/CopY family transcriptional regulator [Aestuariibacter halophilus]|uniref:BlaI/MecI/CopY family transcriptional regulator n=1 Tax=Fluctibacter halophilus TaxID=226011 RepID=A0ABS8GCA3_9ALTE|nr:BlaI/MecI/CopY family transcriptional regulator [Aestuariibacter halophilus]MCC2618200.1 BlaI/MecI/CopY family transcriptional regulator [Aestuariibacter halophilus]
MHQPTAPELAILKLLWQQQPRSARELHEHLTGHFDWSYSSTRKTLQRMGEKGLVAIQEQGNKKIYRAQVEKMAVLASMATDLAKRVFELDGPLPVAMFADSHLIKDEELQELERLLNQPKED